MLPRHTTSSETSFLALRQFAALAALTAVEALRQPVSLLLLLAGTASTTLVPLVLLNNFDEDGKLARDGGMAFHLVFGLLVTVLAASSSLNRELRSGTASAILSRQVSRNTFFLSKFAGISAVVVIYSACATLATLLAERISEKFTPATSGGAFVTDWQTGALLAVAPLLACLGAALLNRRYGRPFASTAFGLILLSLFVVLLAASCFSRDGHFAPFHPNVDWRVLPASALITLALIAISAVALTLSVRLSSTPTLTLTAALVFLGLISDYVFGRFAGSSTAAAAIYAIIPNWQHFWVPDTLDNGGVIPWGYVAGAGAYAAAWAGGMLGVGMLLFRHTEIR